MHDALDIASASRPAATCLPARCAMTPPRARRPFHREAFDDWVGARRVQAPRG
jgi:hypothetical protein